MCGIPDRCFVVAVVSLLLTFPLACGDDQDGPEKDAEDATQHLVDDITVSGIREDGTHYRVEQSHLLTRFYDPERGGKLKRTQTGALWAWGEGRPVALIEVWRWRPARTWGHTVISTTPGLVTASVANVTWAPERPGLQFTELQGAPAPAETSPERTNQMRQLAERFTGYEMVRRDVVNLTMSPDPLYRYDEEGIDGAIFTLAHNKNPEAILFLESVSNPNRPDYWRYAWAKCTSSPVTVELDGDELLHIPGSLNDQGSASEPFWVFFRTSAEVPTEREEEEERPSPEYKPTE